MVEETHYESQQVKPGPGTIDGDGLPSSQARVRQGAFLPPLSHETFDDRQTLLGTVEGAWTVRRVNAGADACCIEAAPPPEWVSALWDSWHAVARTNYAMTSSTCAGCRVPRAWFERTQHAPLASAPCAGRPCAHAY